VAYRQQIEKKLTVAKMIRCRPIFNVIDEDRWFFKTDGANRQDCLGTGMDFGVTSDA